MKEHSTVYGSSNICMQPNLTIGLNVTKFSSAKLNEFLYADSGTGRLRIRRLELLNWLEAAIQDNRANGREEHFGMDGVSEAHP